MREYYHRGEWSPVPPNIGWSDYVGSVDVIPRPGETVLRDFVASVENLGKYYLETEDLAKASVERRVRRTTPVLRLILDQTTGGCLLGEFLDQLGPDELACIRDDLYEILDAFPAEVSRVLEALRAGAIDGNLYEGDCCCLVGTIAKDRLCSYTELGIQLNSKRLAERWFFEIHAGDRPETNLFAKQAEEWIVAWLKAKEGRTQ